MNKSKITALGLTVAGLVAGCSGPRWQIVAAKYDSKDVPILLDARTGHTWVLDDDRLQDETPNGTWYQYWRRIGRGRPTTLPLDAE